MRKSTKFMMGLLTFVCAMGGSVVLAEPAAEKVDYGETFCYWGDVDGDEKVSLEDANEVLKGALGIEKPDAKYEVFFDEAGPVLDDAQQALQTSLGIVSQKVVTMGAYVKLDIEREYIIKDDHLIEDEGISTGAYVMGDRKNSNDFLVRLAKELGEDDAVFKELKSYFDEFWLTDPWAVKSSYVPAVMVANMYSYFDQNGNAYDNGFKFINTSEDTYKEDDISGQGYFIAREEIHCVSNEGKLEIRFAEDASGKDGIMGKENAKLYMSVVLLPRWVTEENVTNVEGQVNQARLDEMLGESSKIEIEKEYMFNFNGQSSDERLSEGLYLVENSAVKNDLLEKVAGSVGEDSEMYKDLKSYLDKEIVSDTLVGEDEVPVVIVTGMRFYFDFGVEVHGSGFCWHNPSGDNADVATVGTEGYYTASNKINVICRESGELVVRLIEDSSVTTPLTSKEGAEREEWYLCVAKLPSKFFLDYQVNWRW